MIEYGKRIVERANQEPGKLTGYNCELCMNRGFFYGIDQNGKRYAKECICMKKRRNLQRLKKSGLESIILQYTFDNWKTNEKWQSDIKKLALKYTNNPNGWFFLSGSPGTGKTHICTAICGSLIDKFMNVRYCLWKTFSTEAKAAINKYEEYQKLVKPIKTVKVLYIDDFFKTKKKSEPSDGDVNLAFEILNERYNDRNLITIISSNFSIGKILEIDEAIGSRIYQRSKEYYVDLTWKKNYRLL